MGRAVTDPSGELIGVVDYLLTDPGTGAVRQAAVSGGAIGQSSYVLVPTANLRMAAGRLITGPLITRRSAGSRRRRRS